MLRWSLSGWIDSRLALAGMKGDAEAKHFRRDEPQDCFRGMRMRCYRVQLHTTFPK